MEANNSRITPLICMRRCRRCWALHGHNTTEKSPKNEGCGCGCWSKQVGACKIGWAELRLGVHQEDVDELSKVEWCKEVEGRRMYWGLQRGGSTIAWSARNLGSWWCGVAEPQLGITGVATAHTYGGEMRAAEV